jgi:hypothetical protein
MIISSGIGREATQHRGHVAGNLHTIELEFARHAEGHFAKLVKMLGLGRDRPR